MAAITDHAIPPGHDSALANKRLPNAAHSDPAEIDPFSRLPSEVLRLVPAYIADHRSLARLCCVSKMWSTLASRDEYWRPLFLARWRAPRNNKSVAVGALQDAPDAVAIEHVPWKNLFEHRTALDRRWRVGDPVAKTFSLPSDTIRVFLRPGWLAVTTSEGSTVLLRTDGSLISNLYSGRRSISNCVAVHPDRTTIATGMSDGEVRLWELATGGYKRTLGNQGSTAFWETNGDRLFSLSSNGMVRMWNASTGACEREEVAVWDIESGALLIRVTTVMTGADFSGYVQMIENQLLI
ncbi:hypothetical protein DFJ73DRAFT_763654 [Zopfochytrium polystomum]|nr:hypothetical protein DFJ73DRAFT_763654 [Zopfochytrium polystomum]